MSQNSANISHFQDLLNLTNDLICIIDTNDKFKFVNPAFSNLLGYLPADLIGKSFKNLIHPRDLEKTLNVISQIEKEKANVEITNRYKTKSGEYISICWKGDFLPTKELFGIGRDVTRDINKNKEAELLSKVVSKTKDILIITNIQGEIIWVNKAFEKITEYSLEEIKGKKPGPILQGPKTDRNTVKLIKEAVDLRKEIDIDILNYSKSGKEYWLNINISPVYNEFGKLEYFMSIEREITKQKKEEEEKRIFDERWKFAIENSGDGIWDYNLISGESFQSNQFLKNLGLVRGEITFNHDVLLSLVHPKDRNRVDELFISHLKNETEYFSCEYRIRNKNGKYKWILDRAKVIERDVNNLPKRVIGIHQDLTSRKKNEQQLIENQHFLKEAQRISKIGSWELNLKTKEQKWSSEHYRIFEIEEPQPSEKLYSEYRKKFILKI